MLQPRDQAILEHIARYRMSTPEVLHHCFFPNASMDATKSVIRRLRGTYLQSRPLYLQRVYYQLTVSTALRMGEPDEAANPLGSQALPRAYAVLRFCCSGETPRERYTRAEFGKMFPFLVENGVPFHDYYLETEGTARLTRILVDLGGDTKRLVRKCARLIRDGMTVPGLRDLIRGDEYAFRIITAEPDKARALREAISENSVLRERPVKITVVPDLMYLLPNQAIRWMGNLARRT